MFRLKRAVQAAALVLIAGCTADAGKVVGPSDGPSRVISDAAHAGAVPGFYFLPPMVPSPSYSGTFDAGLTPRVEICELSGTACGATIATFTYGTGSTSVRVSASDQHYIVNWHTGSYNLNTAKTYRINVYQGTFLLGFADVDVVGSAKDLKNVDTQQFIPLLDDRTLPIKFRVETGIVAQVVVSPPVDTINVGQTSQFTATLIDLHGNTVSGPAVTWTSSAPAVATIDATGLATGVAPGTTTITASLGYVSGTATLVVEQPNQPPVAAPDTFEAIGNVTVPVSASGGLLANDTDPDGDALSVTAGSYPTAAGGTVVLNGDGSFTYLSAAGFTGTDSFSYEISDGIATSNATVTVTVPTRVWYVSAAASGDGRDASPFGTLAEAEGASTAGETIFLLAGSYGTGITLKNGQSLTGQGVGANVTASLNGETVVLLAAGGTPVVGGTIQLAQDNTVQGLSVASPSGAGIAGSGIGTFTAALVNVSAQGGPALDLASGTVAAAFGTVSSSNSAGAGLELSGLAGSLTASGGNITGAAGAGVAIAGGNGTIDYAGDVSGSGAGAATVSGRTGGSVTLSGALVDAGSGIVVQNNTGGSIAFTGPSKSLNTGAENGVTLANNGGAAITFGGGGLAIATTTGTGFSATGGGTVTVTGADNAIGATAGTAVRVENTTIGASGITFRSVSASNGANGIVLVNTGALNGMQVTGTGAAGSGGTIQDVSGADGSTAGIGVYLSNVRNVSLSSMQLSGFDNFAIRGFGVIGFSMTGTVVSGVSGNSAAADEAAVAFDGLTGQAQIVGSSVSGGVEDNFRVVNAAGILDRISFVNSTIGSNGVTDGDDALKLTASGTAVLNVTVQNGTFTGARGDLLQLTLANTASSDLVVTGSTFNNAHPNTISGAGGISIGTAGAGSPTLTYAISNSSFRGSLGSAIAVAKVAGTGSFTGTISGNTIGASGVANSGSAQGSAISLELVGGGSHAATVTGNQIFQFTNFGVRAQAGGTGLGGQGRMDLVVTGNQISEPSPNAVSSGFVTNGIRVQSGVNAGDNAIVCATIGGAGALANSLTGTGVNGGTDVRLFERFLTTMALPGYAGAPNDNAAAGAFVAGNNGGATVLASNNVAAGGPGFVGTCP